MRSNFHHLDKYRVLDGRMGSTPSDGRYGFFLIPVRDISKKPHDTWVLYCLASAADEPEAEGWEHVSLRVESATDPKAGRLPTWEEMCLAKKLFFEPNECVVQFHPPESEYVNAHPNVLHLWRNTQFDFKTPPTLLIGPKPESK
jgi:hypothetical protein